jgi:Domain of unknown function (DUF222)
VDRELAHLRRRTADRVSELEEMPVGPGLMAGLLELRAAPAEASTAVRQHALWAKVISFATAEQMLTSYDSVYAIRSTLATDSRDEAQMLAAQEIACATHLSYASARDHVALVERIAQSLGYSWEALDRGDITLAHLKAVEKTTRQCPPRVAQAVDEKVIALAVQRGWTPSETARAARRIVISLDPEGAKDRAAAAKDNADVQLYPGEDETSTICATGDAVLARQMMDAINDHAEAMARAGDDRNVGVRRFHALADLVCGTANSAPASVNPDGTVATRAADRGTTLTHIDLATLLGLNDHPGELVGYGPITADTARRIAADSMLRRMVTDPLTGDTLDLGLKSYRPSTALQRLIEATHPTCTMPGCSRPSTGCEIDHRHERHDGGRTDKCNLKPLCKMHHQLKTKGRWRVDQHLDGSETWTSYLGFTYSKRPKEFDLPEPLAAEDDPPEEVADRLPVELFDPDPPIDQTPLPAPPALTEEQYAQMSQAMDFLNAIDLTFKQWCDKHYDEARATGLVA